MINDIVDAVYVITVSDNSDRYEYINNYLNKLNINFILKVSVDKTFFQEFVWDKHHVNKSEQSLSSTYASIFYESIYKKYDKILILEDDNKFIIDFDIEFNKFFTHLPEKWDILHLGSNTDEKTIKKLNVNQYVDRIFIKYSANCMMFKGRSTFEIIAKHIIKSKYQIDFIFNHVYSTKELVCYSPVLPLTEQLSYRPDDINNNNKIFKSLIR